MADRADDRLAAEKSAAGPVVPVLKIDSLSKSYPGQLALDHAQLTVFPRQIHALLGQNGSGKSTLIKALSGFHKPDPGAAVEMFGHPVDLTALSEADRARTRVLHQDLGLVGSLNVMENLALGRGFGNTQYGRIRWGAERHRVSALLTRFGLDVDPRRAVGTLGAAEQAIVGLARAMQDWDESGGLLILDEPTASLPKPEVQRLFDALHRAADHGAGILLVTHRLDEVLTVADWVTVLRDGRTVASSAVKGLGERQLIEWIVGRPIENLYPEPPEPRGETVFDVRGLWGSVVEDFSLSVRVGEIVGIAGITGSGREEIAALLSGSARRAAGVIGLDAKPVPKEPGDAQKLGLVYVPADRKRDGSIQNQSVADNITLSRLAPLYKRGWLTNRRVNADAMHWITQVDLKPPDPNRALSTLSGGNQQKAVIARVLRLRPRVVIFDEPTQGVDVGAKATIYELLAKAAAGGAALIVCSSDAEELANVCDRVVVVRHGRQATELHGNRLTSDTIVEQSLR